MSCFSHIYASLFGTKTHIQERKSVFVTPDPSLEVQLLFHFFSCQFHDITHLHTGHFLKNPIISVRIVKGANLFFKNIFVSSIFIDKSKTIVYRGNLTLIQAQVTEGLNFYQYLQVK